MTKFAVRSFIFVVGFLLASWRKFYVFAGGIFFLGFAKARDGNFRVVWSPIDNCIAYFFTFAYNRNAASICTWYPLLGRYITRPPTPPGLIKHYIEPPLPSSFINQSKRIKCTRDKSNDAMIRFPLFFGIEHSMTTKTLHSIALLGGWGVELRFREQEGS